MNTKHLIAVERRAVKRRVRKEVRQHGPGTPARVRAHIRDTLASLVAAAPWRDTDSATNALRRRYLLPEHPP